ncbi:MAG: zinc-binding dehydrogenase, partial [Actinobacteria bacterium]|nr:zinc-binding dehydrogenase [Actinomycetota bacterium]
DVLCGQCWYCRHIYGWPWCANNKAYGNAFTSAKYPHLFGGWSEYIYVLPKALVFKVPDGMPAHIAVLSEIMSVSYSLEKASEFSSVAKEGFFTGCTVVVQGAGPMGLCTLIKARIKGAGEIISIDGSDYRLGMAKECAADHTFNIGTSSQQERIEFVKNLTDGRGADLIVEASGSAQAIVEALEMLRRGGMYIVAGNALDKGEDVSINAARHFCTKNVRLLGMNNHSHVGHYDSMKLMQKYADRFAFEKIISHRYSIDNAEAGLKKSMEPDSMKVVITPTGV